MNVALLKDSHDEALWDHFVLGHPQASGYHTLAWRGVISKVFGHRTYYLMASDEGGTVLGVLPLVLTKSPMFGCFLTSMAFLQLWRSIGRSRRCSSCASGGGGGNG